MYHLEVSIKAYEPRYLNQASTAIRDLMFINLAPQAAAAGASDVPGPHNSSISSGTPSPVNLAMPIQHIPIRLNWKRSRFTVIRGPHIDKKGREQFEMRKYKVLVRGATHSAQDVHWFLDSIRLYEFPGVQIQVSLNSNSYLTPLQAPTTAEPGQRGERGLDEAAHSPSVLSEHRSRISRYLMPGKIAAQVQGSNNNIKSSNSSSSSSTGSADGDLEGALRSLRKVVYAGLQQQRQQLSGSEDYQRWHMTNKLKTPHLATLPPSDLDPWASGSRASTSSTDLLLGRQLQELSATAIGTSSSDASGVSSSGSTSSSSSIGTKSGVGEGKSRAAAFLAAADAVFLNLRFEALESHRHFPLHFATYQIGHEVPAAQWMSAVMRAGQFARDMEARAQEYELMSLYTQYSLFAHSLLYTLYKMWLGSNKEEAGRYLAMPPDAGVVERFIIGSSNAQRGSS